MDGPFNAKSERIYPKQIHEGGGGGIAGVWDSRTGPVKTLRDEFAMAALNSMAYFKVEKNGLLTPEQIAYACYGIADAMLSARDKK